MWQTVRDFSCFLLPPLAVLTAFGLLAIWAATSRRHWFARAMTLCGAVLLFVPIRAYEPAAICALALPLIVAAIVVQRRPDSLTDKTLQSETAAGAARSLRFALRDLLLLTALVAVILFGWRTINRSYEVRDWLALLTSAATLATTVFATHGIVMGRRRWPYLILLSAILIGAPYAIVEMVSKTQVVSAWKTVGVNAAATRIENLTMAAAIHILLGLLTFVFLVLSTATKSRNGLWRRAAMGMLPMLAVGLSILPVLIYWRLFWLTPFPPPMTVRPNHFPRLLAIAESLGGNRGRGMVPGTNPAQLAAEAAILVDSASYVVMDERFLSKAGLNEHQNSASAIREVARLFEAEAKAAELAGNSERAADWGIASVRLGTLMNRGGDSTDAFIGSSAHAVGLVALVKVRESLSASGRQSVLGALTKWQEGAESDEVILQRSAAYADRAWDWSDRLEDVQLQLLGYDIERAILQRMRQENLALANLLRADLAIRQFRDSRGRWPADMRELLLDHLPEIPIDPYCGDALKYRPGGDTFVLYSIGPDENDNGGRFTNRRNYRGAGFDYDLDTHSRP